MIDNVIEWLETLGVAVHLDSDVESSQYHHEQRRVEIRKHKNKQELLFSLLHEAGHVVLRYDGSFHREMYPSKYHEDPEIKFWLNDLLQEEYDAWQEGFVLSQKLSLNVDHEKYERFADECLNTYRAFATSVDRFSEKLVITSGAEFNNIFNYFEPLMK